MLIIELCMIDYQFGLSWDPSFPWLFRYLRNGLKAGATPVLPEYLLPKIWTILA